jgi:dihydrofolate reductase
MAVYSGKLHDDDRQAFHRHQSRRVHRPTGRGHRLVVAAVGGRRDYGYAAFLDSVDGIVMGRGSFQTVVGFDPWPYPKPVVILSHALRQSDLRADLVDKVTISTLGPADLIQEMAGKGWRSLYVDGGRVIQSFLRAGLISEIVVSRLPILTGDGISLFGAISADIAPEHVEITAYASGLVQSALPDKHRAAALSAARSDISMRQNQARYWPPLALRVEPVMKPAVSAARKTTQRAISSGSPSRPTGICGMIFSFSTFSGTARTISVPI